MRTKILSVALAAVVVAGMAGAGLFLSTSSVSATAEGESYATVTELSGASYNGVVEEIHINSTGYVEWKNMPSDDVSVHVQLQARDGQGGWDTFGSEVFQDASGQSGSYSYDSVGGELLANTNFESSDFSSGEDGETRKEYIAVRVKISVVSADGEVVCVTDKVHKVKIKATNLDDPAAKGDSEIDGDVKMNEQVPDCEDDC